MPLAEDEDMIQTVAPERPDQTLSIGILPGRLRRYRAAADSHRPETPNEGLPVSAIIVTHQIGRCMSQGNIELMPKKEILELKSASRLEQVGDKCPEQIEHGNHRVG